MNVPEYRRAVRGAQGRFEAAVREAAEHLAKDLAAADEKFFEDENKPVEIDDEYAALRRVRP